MNELRGLDEIVEWMRTHGVLTLRLSNGTELELTTAPRLPAGDSVPKTEKKSPGQLALERRARVNDVLFRGSTVRPK